MEKFPQHSPELQERNLESLAQLKKRAVAWSLSTRRKSSVVLLKSDSTSLAVDAVVNAANEFLMGGGGVDEAIHAKAGPELNKEIEKNIPVRPNGARCMSGEAVLTLGHGLPAKHIIHTVAPYFDEKGNLQPAVLHNCYRASLKLAEENAIATVAFPPIGTGFYGYPMLEAAQIAFEECCGWLDAEGEGRGRKVMFCFVSELQYEVSKELYENYVKEEHAGK